MQRVYQRMKRFGGVARWYSTLTPDDDACFCYALAEPFYRYRPGGYHPIHIGDTLNGRYKVLNKLGWGGFSTVWAVLDQQQQRCFALKAVISDNHNKSQEIDVMRAIASSDPRQPGHRHLLSKHDHFRLDGPNGTHDCLVLDIVGLSVQETVQHEFNCKRLPAQLVISIFKQVALGVACLHQQGVAHADIHTGNIFLSNASTLKLSDPAWWSDRHVQMEPVRSKDQQPVIAPGQPKYLVEPISLPISLPLGSPSQCLAKISDYGEAFVQKFKPTPSHGPLVVRAPEAILNDRIDFRADLWSLGCALFELATGQPPFDSLLATPVSVVTQILETSGDTLPGKWQPLWLAIVAEYGPFPKPEPAIRLQEWLEKVYYFDNRQAEFSPEDIRALGRIIQKLLRLEPAERASAKEILEDPWFNVFPGAACYQ